MTREELAEKIEELDRAMVAEMDAAAEAKLCREMGELIAGDNLRLICRALRA